MGVRDTAPPPEFHVLTSHMALVPAEGFSRAYMSARERCVQLGCHGCWCPATDGAAQLFLKYCAEANECCCTWCPSGGHIAALWRPCRFEDFQGDFPAPNPLVALVQGLSGPDPNVRDCLIPDT